jgi:hypothetical protein
MGNPENRVLKKILPWLQRKGCPVDSVPEKLGTRIFLRSRPSREL